MTTDAPPPSPEAPPPDRARDNPAGPVKPRRGLLELTLHGRMAIISTALTAALALWLAGLFWFAATIPVAGALTQPDRHTDAVVVLTGGSNRLQTGIDLLRERRADKLFVTGVYRGVEVHELLGLARDAPQDLECCIELDYEADDTVGNAAETARWMHRHGYRSLRLVTANYHMRRSLLEFRMAQAADIIIPHPIQPTPPIPEDWWRHRQDLSLMVGEYTKYLITLARYALFRLA